MYVKQNQIHVTLNSNIAANGRNPSSLINYQLFIIHMLALFLPLHRLLMHNGKMQEITRRTRAARNQGRDVFQLVLSVLSIIQMGLESKRTNRIFIVKGTTLIIFLNILVVIIELFASQDDKKKGDAKKHTKKEDKEEENKEDKKDK